ncbi:hypothetical protein ACP70R_034901 [Stipagrostis hirtigluma subsp. patula]
MPRYDDRYGNTRLYVGRLSYRTRSRDLEYLFSRYGSRFSVFYTNREVCGGRVPLVDLVAIGPKFVEAFGEGRPWCTVVDCFSGSSKLVMHLSTHDGLLFVATLCAEYEKWS